MTDSRPGREAGSAGSRASEAVREIGVRLAGTGVALPERVLTNDELAKSVDTSDAWIIKRTGIKQRRVADQSVGARELAAGAMRQALDRAEISPTELDMLICATITPEMCMPSTAARVVADIGADPAGAFDLSAACSGFVYAMNLAASLIQTGAYGTVGVVGAESLSKIVNWEDRGTCILFGDGAGAAILTADKDPERGCLYQSMRSNGHMWAELYCPRSEADLPADHEAFNGQLGTMQMNGREVFKFAVTTLEGCIDEVLGATGLAASDLAMIIPHQSNARILESARVRLDLPREKMCVTIDRFGNTSAASVPISLHEMREQGRLHSGDLVLFVAMGGGMTWATSLWRL